MVRLFYIVGALAWLATVGVTTLCIGNLSQAPQSISSPSVTERFKLSKTSPTSKDRQKISPLVQQAKILAAFLNPPSPPKPTIPATQIDRKPTLAMTPKVKPPKPSTKFELHGISFRRSRPHDSMALVWLPDTGHRWVKEGTQLGHVTIAQIQGDSILCLAGDETQRIALDTSQIDMPLARHRPEKPTRQRLDNPTSDTPRPPPALGIRQMPIERIAAKLGVSPKDLETETP